MIPVRSADYPSDPEPQARPKDEAAELLREDDYVFEEASAPHNGVSSQQWFAASETAAAPTPVEAPSLAEQEAFAARLSESPMSAARRAPELRAEAEAAGVPPSFRIGMPAGAAAGAMAGAAVGIIAGPIGVAAGAAIGGVVGAVAGAIDGERQTAVVLADDALDREIGVVGGSIGDPAEPRRED
ncbi:MAG: hypothetical protein WKG00_33440 [Polyangiaceae bacterium]